MVMPCSRSASSPSVSNDKSRASCPRLLEARATAASWSSNMARVSCSSRPISVLLPSSTLPAVMKRNTPRSSTAGVRSISPSKVISEVSFLLAPFHGGFRGLVVHARRPALGDRGQRRLGDDLGGCCRGGFHRAGAADVADGTKAYRQLFDGLPFARRGDVRDRQEEAVPAHDGPAVRIINGGNGEPLARDVLPDVELGPVADREHAHVLALRHSRVVQAPELGSLVLRVPLAELVAEREHALLGARLFLVAPRAADRGVERKLSDRFEQGHRLCSIPAFIEPAQFDRAAADRILDRAHYEPLAEVRRSRVAECNHLREIVPGVDVHEGKRKLRGTESLLRKAQQHDRILA